MKVTELNREQLNELKQSLATLKRDEQGQDISYDELVNAIETISDKEVFEYYEGVEFTEDDFFTGRKENEEMKNKLVERINKEQEEYLNELKKQPSEVVIKKCYEICYRDEFINVIENSMMFDEEDYETLLKLPSILSYLYDEWLETDVHIGLAIEDTLDEVIKELKNNN